MSTTLQHCDPRGLVLPPPPGPSPPLPGPPPPGPPSLPVEGHPPITCIIIVLLALPPPKKAKKYASFYI